MPLSSFFSHSQAVFQIGRKRDWSFLHFSKKLHCFEEGPFSKSDGRGQKPVVILPSNFPEDGAAAASNNRISVQV